jgi:hypothetical protein
VAATFSTTPGKAEPWRRATLIAGSIAAAEFVALVAVGVILLGRPLVHALAGRSHPSAVAAGAARSIAPRVDLRSRTTVTPATAIVPRGRVRIMVLNGNGQNGAAARAAGRLHRLGYRIAGTANAARMNYAMSIVLYRPGYRPEGLRLAREIGVKVVGPLDGIRSTALRGGDIAVILGG